MRVAGAIARIMVHAIAPVKSPERRLARFL